MKGNPNIRAVLSEDNFLQEGRLSLQKNLDQKKFFEHIYIDLRKKEKRLYSDEVLKSLPDIPSGNSLSKEWLLRKTSAKRILAYLSKRKIGSVLEIGCGNGWLSNYLAENLNALVVGVDVNETELRQATRVFKNDNLAFVYADVLTDAFKLNSFDIILMASSIQYFKDTREVIQKTLPLLRDSGELHIMDSPLYKAREIDSAKKRTKEYFQSMGQPEMAAFYYHHTLNDFMDFKYSFLYNPRSIFNKVQRLFFNLLIFPWIRIMK